MAFMKPPAVNLNVQLFSNKVQYVGEKNCSYPFATRAVNNTTLSDLFRITKQQDVEDGAHAVRYNKACKGVTFVWWNLPPKRKNQLPKFPDEMSVR